MKKVFLSIIVLLLTANIFAQEITSSPPKAEMLKHEVGVSIGAISVFAHIPIVTPAINFSYYYNFNAKHSLGCLFSIVPFYGGNAWLQDNAGCWFAPELSYRFTYYRSTVCSFYLAVSVGAQLGFTSALEHGNINANGFIFAPVGYQLDLFGIKIGKIHSTIIELGYGTQGIIKIGYKYNFNSKN
ncbi:MAG: hypothetical protein LBU51_01620 [Bacteroidales bacterium]|nr:hypothetical protein [Bacteroidales bacterium]